MKHPVDVHVGKRIRQRRWMIGMTQQALADAIGIKFQQVQKYETGMNRVSASRLWEIAHALDVSISFFFDGLGRADADPASECSDLIGDRDAVQLMRAYQSIPERQRRKLVDLAKVMSDQVA